MKTKTVVKWSGVFILGMILGSCTSRKLVPRKGPDTQLVAKWVDETRTDAHWLFNEDLTGERDTPEHRTFTWATPFEGQVVVTLAANAKFPAERVTYSYSIKEDKMSMWPKGVDSLTSVFTRQK